MLTVSARHTTSILTTWIIWGTPRPADMKQYVSVVSYFQTLNVSTETITHPYVSDARNFIKELSNTTNTNLSGQTYNMWHDSALSSLSDSYISWATDELTHQLNQQAYRSHKQCYYCSVQQIARQRDRPCRRSRCRSHQAPAWWRHPVPLHRQTHPKCRPTSHWLQTQVNTLLSDWHLHLSLLSTSCRSYSRHIGVGILQRPHCCVCCRTLMPPLIVVKSRCSVC